MTAHAELAAGRWRTLTLCQQLGNIGSEVSRAVKWKGRNPGLSDSAVVRALELLDLTIADPRWSGRLKELLRAREVLCDAWLGGALYGSSLGAMDRYFYPFAASARSRPAAT